MLKKRILVILLAVALLTTCAAVTASARGRVDVDAAGSLALNYSYEGQGFSGLNIRIYRVAEISTYGQYHLTGAFTGYPVEINNVKTQDEWKQVASTLAAYVVSDGIVPDREAVTAEDGTVHFADLTTGLYFVERVRAEYDRGYCEFGGFVISVPTVDEKDDWVYDVTATPKSVYHQILPEDITYTVSKLWKDAGNENKRPQNVELELYKDGELMETVVLSAENDWTYSWTAPDDGAVWHAVEANVPDGYTVTLSQQGNYFYVTNTFDAPPESPKTGDTANIYLIVGLMILSGAVLVVLGMGSLRGKKR